jgi:hypothetical protein
LLVFRTWPDVADERKAVYKEFITALANISYSNLKQFHVFDDIKVGNLSTANYHDILEKVIKIGEIIINKNKQEI